MTFSPLLSVSDSKNFLLRLDRKTKHFNALTKSYNTSAIADHVKTTGHCIKWDNFDILAKSKTDYHCKIKETLFIQELEPAFNVNVGSEKLMLSLVFFCSLLLSVPDPSPLSYIDSYFKFQWLLLKTSSLIPLFVSYF